MSRKAIQRCAVVLNALGWLQQTLGQPSASAGSVAGPLLCVLSCARGGRQVLCLWPTPACSGCCCRQFWSTSGLSRRPRTRTVLVCYGSGAVAPSLGLASTVCVR